MRRVHVDTIAVLRLSPDVAARLRAAPQDAGRVHSVFDRVLNLGWHDGRLLTLQGPGRLVAPFAAELQRLPRSDGMRPGLGVRRHDDTLALAGVTLEWQDAMIADTAMPASAAGPGPALSVLLAEPTAESGPGLSSTIGRGAELRVAEALSRRDPEALIEGACRLIGLGEGLTPSGDDYLVGLLAVIHRFARSWLEEHPEIQASVGETAAAATTAVAREFLTHALAGHFAENLIDLLTAESVDAVGRAAAQLLRTGATSGADTLAGVRSALVAFGAWRE